MSVPDMEINNTLAEGLRYLQLGWRLCLLRPQSKAPFLHEWNDKLRVIGTPEQLTEALTRYPNAGLGLVHEHSQTGAIDIDHIEYCAIAFKQEMGIDFAKVFVGYPRIRSRDGRDKYVFRVPAGFEGTTKKINWPHPEADPNSPDAAIRNKRVVLLEFRHKGAQDALPPTIHPDTLQPYSWIIQPVADIPLIPPAIAAIWLNFNDFKPQFESACPWSTEKPKAPPPPKRQVHRGGESVIDRFNQTYEIAGLLESYGYQRKGKRWLAPSTTTGIPGVVVLAESGKCYSHHASDPLNDGHSHDAFDVFCILEMGGQFNNAINEARLRLNLQHDEPPLVDITELLKTKKTGNNTKPSQPPVELPEPFRGPMAWAVEVAIKNAFRKQPRFCMMSALAGMAAACHGGYKQPDDIRHNISLVGHTSSTSGKTTSSKVASDLAALAGAVIMGKPSSGAAIEDHLVDKGTILMDWDEVAHLVEAINDAKQPHKRDIGEKLLVLSGASSGIYRTRARAKMDRNDESTAVEIANPCVTVLGFSTTSKLGVVMSEDNIKDGLLGRFLFVEGEGQVPLHRNKGMVPYPQALIDRAQEIKRTRPCVLTQSEIDAGKISGPNELRDITVIISAAADAYLDDFLASLNAEELSCKNTIEQALLGRTFEKILKISGVLAIWDNPAHPIMEIEHIDWSVRFVKASNQCAMQFAENYMNHGAVLNEARSIIQIVKKILAREFKTRNAAQDKLIESGKAPYSLALKKSRLKADLFNTAVIHAVTCGDIIGGVADDAGKTKWLAIPTTDD